MVMNRLCYFCFRTEREVAALVTSLGAAICDGCIADAAKSVAENLAGQAGDRKPAMTTQERSAIRHRRWASADPEGSLESGLTA
jgi:ATP-dependent protease Clp ATPase subunit